jgi:hypothetical protein
MIGALASEGSAACFFNYCGIVHYVFTPEGQTVNKDI